MTATLTVTPVDANDPRPAYEQIADDLRARISSGQLTGRLPSTRDLSAAYGVAMATLQQAMSRLNDVIYRVQGQGTYVRLTSNAETIPIDQFRQLADGLATRASQLEQGQLLTEILAGLRLLTGDLQRQLAQAKAEGRAEQTRYILRLLTLRREVNAHRAQTERDAELADIIAAVADHADEEATAAAETAS